MDPSTLTRKLITAHLEDGDATPGNDIRVRFDQTLTQDATGTLVMLTLEALELDRVAPATCVQYVDHNLLEQDNLNADDHRFLLSAAHRFGVWFSRPGNGVSHPLHMQHFGKPGAALIGADSNTPAAGSLGMLAIGAGGTDVARAMAGEPIQIRMPSIWGIELTGELPAWVSAKDVVLEMLRRYGVDGAVNCALEYYGDGLGQLSAMDRHVIANMGTELGATTSVFPADDAVLDFLAAHNRGADFTRWSADAGCRYDHDVRIDLGGLVPLIARPSNPGDVVPVTEVAGQPIYQSYIGSSANPGHRDFAIAAEIVRDRLVPSEVSFDINPTSRALLDELIGDGRLTALLAAGARLHQAGCNGCIGMGQAPAAGQISLRTTPRNFPGRSGTPHDLVYLCSPETAAASALTGRITDPRELEMPYPDLSRRPLIVGHQGLFEAPMAVDAARRVQLEKGANIESLPQLDALPDNLSVPVLARLGDNVSTDEILPAGAKVLPLRSNIPAIAEFSFAPIIEAYPAQAREAGPHAIVAGANYGQGSSREHAALAPRYLGLRCVVAASYARIHWQNLVNFGVLPLTFTDGDDIDRLAAGTRIAIDTTALRPGETVRATIDDDNTIELAHALNEEQLDMVRAGGWAAWRRRRSTE